MSATDEELMALWAEGDRAAMGELVERFAPRLRAFFARAGSDAPDLLQQTFLKVHLARRTYRPGASFKAWLFTIAANSKVDAARRSKLRGNFGDDEVDEVASIEVLQDEIVWRRQLAQLVNGAIDTLPDRQRDVLHLHFVEGLSFGEIALVWQVSESAIKQCAFRAYTALRARLTGFTSEESK
jgi:RNA polymerase sigma factor (sigma-70 family)